MRREAGGEWDTKTAQVRAEERERQGKHIRNEDMTTPRHNGSWLWVVKED